MYADLVLFNGKIYTLNSGQPRAQALAARDGKIVYVGDDAIARDLLRPGGEAIDLKGCCVIPGLTDAHVHFRCFAMGLRNVNAETPTLGEALARVAEHTARKPPGGWVIGQGWNQNVWGNESGFISGFPTAAHLDRVAPDHPVALDHKSGHAMWANSRALELAGITAETPDPPGGQIVRDATGQPTGTLLEEAMKLVEDIIPEPPLDELVEAMRQAMLIANRAGLTGVHDFDGPLAFSAHQVLHQPEGRKQGGELSLRVTKSIPLKHLDEAIGLGLRTGFGDDWLRVGHVKMFADGALGPRTALMLEGYDSAPEETGIATSSIEEIRQAVNKATAAGLACAIHAIGDKANRDALDVYQATSNPSTTLPQDGKSRRTGQQSFDYASTRQQEPQDRPAILRLRSGQASNKLRHRIEHVQLLHPDDLGRLAELGVIASMQPLHATSDMHVAERHWGKRCAGAYALKTLLERGTVLALGSDCPVEVIDPLVGIHAAVTRRRTDGSPGPDGWYPEQHLSVEQAVRGFTQGPAYATGMEDKLGSLKAGKLADMTILERDIFAIEPMEILNARVMGTIVGGKFVWRNEGLS